MRSNFLLGSRTCRRPRVVPHATIQASHSATWPRQGKHRKTRSWGALQPLNVLPFSILLRGLHEDAPGTGDTHQGDHIGLYNTDDAKDLFFGLGEGVEKVHIVHDCPLGNRGSRCNDSVSTLLPQ